MKYSLIGCAVFVIAIVGVFVLVGPKEVLSSILFSLSNDTEFAPGFSQDEFDKIKIGDPESAVISAVGKPISEYKSEAYTKIAFAGAPNPEFRKEGIVRGDVDYTTFTFSTDGTLKSAHGQKFISRTGGGMSNIEITFQMGDAQNFLGIKNSEIEALKKTGATQAVIEAKYGKPAEFFESTVVRGLIYSRSPSSDNYHQRKIGLDEAGNVAKIVNKRYWD